MLLVGNDIYILLFILIWILNTLWKSFIICVQIIKKIKQNNIVKKDICNCLISELLTSFAVYEIFGHTFSFDDIELNNHGKPYFKSKSKFFLIYHIRRKWWFVQLVIVK